MNLTQHLKSYPSLLGERYDMKTCWEATDNFFDCLDREGLINGTFPIENSQCQTLPPRVRPLEG